MDFRNNSIPVDKVTSTDVNKTIQRSLTKAVARHGLGLYIYAGEDLPEEERQDFKNEIISAKEANVLKKMLEKRGIEANNYKGKKIETLTAVEYTEALETLKKMGEQNG
jgi:tripartite-type tricarboxylate transporter receptor subunit TctC